MQDPALPGSSPRPGPDSNAAATAGPSAGLPPDATPGLRPDPTPGLPVALLFALVFVEGFVSLGAEIADFWSLPSSGLPASAQQKMSEVCDRSRATVEDEILAAGCMP